MHDIIPHFTQQIDDERLTAARKALAELPPADTNDKPWFWVGRLRVHLEILTAARKALAELPPADTNDKPWFWVGRLRVHLEILTAAWPAGASGGLDDGQRDVLGQALADAAAYREQCVIAEKCEACDADPDDVCSWHAADLDLAEAYTLLGRELGIAVQR